MVWETGNVQKLFLRETSSPEMQFSIARHMTLTVRSDQCQPVTLPFLVFIPSRSAACENIIINVQAVPQVQSAITTGREVPGTTIQTRDGPRQSVFHYIRMPPTEGVAEAVSSSGRRRTPSRGRSGPANDYSARNRCAALVKDAAQHSTFRPFSVLLSYVVEALTSWHRPPLPTCAQRLENMSAIVATVESGVPLSSPACYDFNRAPPSTDSPLRKHKAENRLNALRRKATSARQCRESQDFAQRCIQDTTAVAERLVSEKTFGPLLYLSKSGTMFSNINDDCREFLTPLTEEEEAPARLGLPELRIGRHWATLALKTSTSSEWSIIVRWSPDSVLGKNILCTQHCIIKGVVLGFVD